MFRRLLLVVLALSVAAASSAGRKSRRSRKSPTPSTSKARSRTPSARNARPRYNPVAERIKFFNAAGKDSELDAKEFTDNRAKANGFVRKTDSWTVMLRFDEDRNKTIDWFEADAYRRSLDQTNKVRVTYIDGSPFTYQTHSTSRSKSQIWADLTRKYDRNRDGKLTGDEKSAAYREYKQIREEQSKSHSSKSSGPSKSQILAELTRKYDRNRDGKLTGDEKLAASREYKQIREEQSKRSR